MRMDSSMWPPPKGLTPIISYIYLLKTMGLMVGKFEMMASRLLRLTPMAFRNCTMTAPTLTQAAV